jgi:hypothetical protein
MKMNILMKNYIIAFTLLIGLFACSKEDFDPKTSFTRIYDHSSAAVSYNPIDVVQTTSGFLILAAKQLDQSDFSGIQLIQLDEAGNFVKEQTLDDNYVAPVGKFISIDSVHYFFGMDENTHTSVLFTVNSDAEYTISAVATTRYPLAAAQTADKKLLLVGYDFVGLQTSISKLELDGSSISSRGYTIGAGKDVETQIISHFTDPDRSALPFFCGEISTGQVYFNGFYNYTLSTVFSSFGGSPDGVLQGQGISGGLSYALPVLGSDFAIFGFQFNENFVLPKVTLNTAGIASSSNFFASPTAEFQSRTHSDIVIWTYKDVRYVIAAGETQNGQVALYIYDYLSGALKGIEKIGYLNTHTLASIKVDKDNGLLVTGATFVSGRYKRAYLKKMSQNELAGVL